MKLLREILLVLLSCSLVNASPVEEKVTMGKQDSRGAYQEVVFRPFELSVDYFEWIMQRELLANAATQKKYEIFPTNKFDFWGREVTIYFQDGEIRTTNEATEKYKALDAKRNYCFVRAAASFDDEKQIAENIFKMDGTVTLVTGTHHWGPVVLGGKPDPNFSQSSAMGYKYSGAYNFDPGTPFNEFGNGKNDQGRIFEVGCKSFNQNEDLSVGLLKKAAGYLVNVIYPE